MGLVTGLTLSSFVTMLSYRLPRRLSIITPGSHCPVCKPPLKPRDLVPVVSWDSASSWAGRTYKQGQWQDRLSPMAQQSSQDPKLVTESAWKPAILVACLSAKSQQAA